MARSPALLTIIYPQVTIYLLLSNEEQYRKTHDVAPLVAVGAGDPVELDPALSLMYLGYTSAWSWGR